METKSKPSKPSLSPYQEGVKKALSQAGQEHAIGAIQSGVPPQFIEQQAGLVDPNTLNQLSQLANMQVASKGDGSLLGDKMGILPAILNSLQGQGFTPFAQKTESLGLDKAIQMANFQQSTNKANMDAQKFPLEMQKLEGELVQQPLQNQKLKTDVAKAKTELRQMQPGFQTDLAKKKAAATEEGQSVTKRNVARTSFGKDLDTYLELDKFVRRGTNLQTNILSGLRSEVQRRGGSIEGAALATRRSVVNRMVPQLARLSSEVGNLNMFEQLAQREMIPSEYESEKTASLKNAFLQEVASAIDEQNGDKVRTTINKFIESEAFDKKKSQVQIFSSVQEVENANLQKGTQIIVKDNTGRYRRAVWE